MNFFKSLSNNTKVTVFFIIALFVITVVGIIIDKHSIVHDARTVIKTPSTVLYDAMDTSEVVKLMGSPSIIQYQKLHNTAISIWMYDTNNDSIIDTYLEFQNHKLKYRR